MSSLYVGRNTPSATFHTFTMQCIIVRQFANIGQSNQNRAMPIEMVISGWHHLPIATKLIWGALKTRVLDANLQHSTTLDGFTRQQRCYLYYLLGVLSKSAQFQIYLVGVAWPSWTTSYVKNSWLYQGRSRAKSFLNFQILLPLKLPPRSGTPGVDIYIIM